MFRPRRMAVPLLALALLTAGCSDDDDESTGDTTTTGAETTAETEATTSTEVTTTDATEAVDPAADDGVTAEGISEERCQQNRDAGTITFVSAFDFAAAASILDVIVADAEGYFEDMCLEVEIVPGFAPSNGPLVAEGVGQIGAAGSLGELVNNNIQGDADLVAVAQYGRTAIEALLVEESSDITELSQLSGRVVGVKGDIPYSIQTMLAQNGVERSSLQEQLLDGFDPVAHFELGIDALPVYKSNEPRTLEAAGVAVRTFDPLDFDVPSSFAVLFTSQSFLDENPTAVQDFVRAAFRGFQFGIEDPDAAVAHSFELINAAGNPNFFAEDGELFRWTTESTLVQNTTPSGEPFGLINPDGFADEVAALVDAGIFEAPDNVDAMIVPDLAAELWDGTDLIWPTE